MNIKAIMNIRAIKTRYFVRYAHYCNTIWVYRIYRDTGVKESLIINTYDSNTHKNLVIGKIYSLYLKKSCSKDDWEYTAVGGFIE